MKKVLMFSTILITFFLILVILINAFDDAMFSSNNSVKSKNECPYWKGSTVYGLLSSVTLNEDESITVTGVQNLCQGQGFDTIKLTDASIILYSGESLSSCPDYVGMEITYKGVEKNKLLFKVIKWMEFEPFRECHKELISPYSKK